MYFIVPDRASWKNSLLLMLFTLLPCLNIFEIIKMHFLKVCGIEIELPHLIVNSFCSNISIYNLLIATVIAKL